LEISHFPFFTKTRPFGLLSAFVARDYKNMAKTGNGEGPKLIVEDIDPHFYLYIVLD
jgi:hypothetical protein